MRFTLKTYILLIVLMLPLSINFHPLDLPNKSTQLNRQPATEPLTKSCMVSIKEYLGEFYPYLLKKLRSGFEFEGYIPSEIGKVKVMQVIRDELAKNFENVSVKEDVYYANEFITTDYGAPSISGDILLSKNYERYDRTYKKITDYTISYTDNGEVKKWEVKHDVTIGYQDDLTPLEITMPIMNDSKDFKRKLAMIKLLKKHGLQDGYESAGIHFHYEWQNPTKKDKFLLILFGSLIETKFTKLFATPKNRKIWTGAMQADGVYKTERETLMKALREGDFDQADGHLNWLLGGPQFPRDFPFVFTEHGTIEFRHLSSTLDEETILVCEQLFRKMVFALRKNPNGAFDLLQEYPAHEMPLEEFFKYIDFDYQANKEIFERMQERTSNL